MEFVMTVARDALAALAPALRVRPELQDFCRFDGAWRVAHGTEKRGWAAFHVVMKGSCSIERADQPAVSLEAGDVLLLPHGDGHVVYGGGDRHAVRAITSNYRDSIRVKQTDGAAVETELICGRLHLERASENLVLRSLPHAIVLKFSGVEDCSSLLAMMRRELELDRPGASAIARDLASAVFVMLLRQYLETDPPAQGLLNLLSARETGRAAAAMLNEPARNWGLDELASIAAVSRATLVRSFRKICAMPPQAFLTEVRLGIARHRIAQTSDSVAQIAADVGYHSEGALSRALYRRYAIRPGSIRKASPTVVEAPDNRAIAQPVRFPLLPLTKAPASRLPK
jgi:AraC family transcriptional regulator, activator of mtrCDE